MTRRRMLSSRTTTGCRFPTQQPCVSSMNLQRESLPRSHGDTLLARGGGKATMKLRLRQQKHFLRKTLVRLSDDHGHRLATRSQVIPPSCRSCLTKGKPCRHGGSPVAFFKGTGRSNALAAETRASQMTA